MLHLYYSGKRNGRVALVEGSTARHIDEGPVGGEIDPAMLDARLDAEISDALRARQHDDG